MVGLLSSATSIGNILYLAAYNAFFDSQPDDPDYNFETNSQNPKNFTLQIQGDTSGQPDVGGYFFMVAISFALVNTLSLMLHGDYPPEDELPKQENDVDEENDISLELSGTKTSQYVDDRENNFQKRILEVRNYDRPARTLSTSYSSYLDHCILLTESIRSDHVHPEERPLLEPVSSNKMKKSLEDIHTPTLVDSIMSPGFHQIGKS